MPRTVCLVIPARDAAPTIRHCLTAAAEILHRGGLSRIIVVDDGSADGTSDVLAGFPVSCLRSPPRGRSAARNLGWRQAESDIVWFMDADCVAEPDALERLLPHFRDPNVAGVGGTFTAPLSQSVLAELIHEEITQRHAQMPSRVDFLATGNAAYRRDVLEQVGGFDEAFLRAQDTELAYRVREAGYELVFTRDSRVRHAHETRWRSYLTAQYQQGYWRFWLHLRHPRPAAGDSYSRVSDNAQPPLALLLLVSLPLLLVKWGWAVPAALALLLAAAQVPMTWRIVARTGKPRNALFAAMSFVRAFARGIGLCRATLDWLAGRRRPVP